MALSGLVLGIQDLEQLKADFRQIVREEISKIKLNSPDPPISRKEAAKYLGIDVSTMHKKFKTGELPTSLIHRVGGRRVFFKSQLEAYIKRS